MLGLLKRLFDGGDKSEELRVEAVEQLLEREEVNQDTFIYFFKKIPDEDKGRLVKKYMETQELKEITPRFLEEVVKPHGELFDEEDLEEIKRGVLEKIASHPYLFSDKYFKYLLEIGIAREEVQTFLDARELEPSIICILLKYFDDLDVSRFYKLPEFWRKIREERIDVKNLPVPQEVVFNYEGKAIEEMLRYLMEMGKTQHLKLLVEEILNLFNVDPDLRHESFEEFNEITRALERQISDINPTTLVNAVISSGQEKSLAHIISRGISYYQKSSRLSHVFLNKIDLDKLSKFIEEGDLPLESVLVYCELPKVLNLIKLSRCPLESVLVYCEPRRLLALSKEFPIDSEEFKVLIGVKAVKVVQEWAPSNNVVVVQSGKLWRVVEEDELNLYLGALVDHVKESRELSLPDGLHLCLESRKIIELLKHLPTDVTSGYQTTLKLISLLTSIPSNYSARFFVKYWPIVGSFREYVRAIGRHEMREAIIEGIRNRHSYDIAPLIELLEIDDNSLIALRAPMSESLGTVEVNWPYGFTWRNAPDSVRWQIILARIQKRKREGKDPRRVDEKPIPENINFVLDGSWGEVRDDNDETLLRLESEYFAELLRVLKDYVSPIIGVNDIERELYSREVEVDYGDGYVNFIDRVRNSLRPQVPSHLYYTVLSNVENGRGLHRIFYEGDGGLKAIYVVVRGSNLQPNGDFERFMNVERYAVYKIDLEQREDGRYRIRGVELVEDLDRVYQDLGEAPPTSPRDLVPVEVG